MNLLLRADVGLRIGAGHVMRCLALAQAWQDAGGCAIFAMASPEGALKGRLEAEGVEVAPLFSQPGSGEDAIETGKLARQRDAGWVVIDGYHFGGPYQRILKEEGLRVLFIDDNGYDDHHYADIVLNQNLHGHEGLYKNREPYTRLLMGTRYVLLRREFSSWRSWKREIPEIAGKVLLTLGGTDEENVTLKIMRALEQLGPPPLEEVAVVVGPGNPHAKALEAAGQESSVPFRLERSAKDMAKLVAWGDLAVSSGGSTCWELAFMGLPSGVVVLAENQAPVAAYLEERGAAINLGWHFSLDTGALARAIDRLRRDRSLRARMSEQGRQVVDGKGSQWVTRALLGEGKEDP